MYFPELVSKFNCHYFSVVGDVPVDSDASVVTLSISRIFRLGLLDVLVWVGCVHVFVHMNVHAYLSASVL
jgi:hypothetical protein